MPIIDRLLSVRSLRKALWKYWYPFLTQRVKKEKVLFLNYAFEEDPPMRIPLAPEEEPNRGCIQLYHHVGTLSDLKGKRVLEVGCGHGGGAGYLSRLAESYVGMDLNPAGIAFCRSTRRSPNLSFVQGDAERIPFPDHSFKAAINVESSHCYPDFPRFLSEAARVLAPGGRLHYADFRFQDAVPDWERDLAGAPFKILKQRDISREVLRGMDMNSERSLGLIVNLLPGWMENLGRDFAGIKGSRIYTALKEGRVSYRSYLLEKS